MPFYNHKAHKDVGLQTFVLYGKKYCQNDNSFLLTVYIPGIKLQVPVFDGVLPGVCPGLVGVGGSPSVDSRIVPQWEPQYVVESSVDDKVSRHRYC